MNKDIIKKIYTDLEKVQGNDRARLLTPNNIISKIQLFTNGKCRNLLKILNDYNLEYALKYQQGNSKNGFAYINTGFTAFFDNNYEVKEIFIYRYNNANHKYFIYIVGYDYLTEEVKSNLSKDLEYNGYEINYKGEIKP